MGSSIQRLCVLTIALCIGILPMHTYAQKKKGKSTQTIQKKDLPKPIEEVVKRCKKIPGLFTLYQDTIFGNLYLQLTSDQLNEEFIYFSHVADGVLDAGYFRGSYRDAKIFSAQRHFNKIEFSIHNTGYYFDRENPLSKAADANINQPIVASLPIKGVDKKRMTFLVEANDLFLMESFQQVKRSPRPGEKPGASFAMGKLSKDKSKYLQVNNYPKNTDVVVEYVYENPYPQKYGTPSVTDSRFISIKMQHSFIQMPEKGFEPRFDDPRVGYFMHQVNDMTSTSATPYRDLIHRWRLQKKDPGAGISDPVAPITWWIENTTPVEFRKIIKDGVMAWNQAFEKAGFSNAVEVKIQPDDADWDAGDIRYNVLRWTSSPIAPFGGYGPSFVNPRTGEILGADIMIEFAAITNRLRAEKVFDLAAFDEESDQLEPNLCDIDGAVHHSLLFARQVFNTSSMKGLDENEFIKQALYRLVLHEVGHTLGLNHNFKASCMNSLADIHNKTLNESNGLTASVMDYPAINFSFDGEKQGLYYDVKPGAYDIWAIEFGYTPALDDPTAEENRRFKLLDRSRKEPALAFANDADDMRRAGKGIDPRAMIYDLSSDAIGYSVNRLELVDRVMGKIKDSYSVDHESYHELRNAYLILTREQSNAARIISRYIGGVYVDRSHHNKENQHLPFEPVALEDQLRAMKALDQFIFGTKAFHAPDSLYNYLQKQRRGFNHFSSTEDPKIHDRVLYIQKDVLNHLLHPAVLKRITDSQLYGNRYELSEMMEDLTFSIFNGDRQTAVSTIRQNLQVEYLSRLIQIVESNSEKNKGKRGQYSHQARSAALFEIERIENLLANAKNPDASTKAHRRLLGFMIEKTKEG